LSSPSKLASSDFLNALSTVSGTDFVGPNITASSLGLPDWSSVHLLTECSHFADGRVDCSKPRYGFEFLPDRDLKLENTPLSLNHSQALTDSLTAYHKASRFLSGAHIIAVVASNLAPIESCFSPLLAAITSGIASLILFAASVASTIIFRNINNAWNAEFTTNNLTSSVGSIPVAFDFAGSVFTLFATIFYILNHRAQSRNNRSARSRRVVAHSVGNVDVGAGGAAAKAGGRLWGRSDHKYVQIEEQQALQAHRDGAGSPDSLGKQRRLDDDWAAPDEYHSGGASSGAASSGPNIPLMTLGGNKQTKDLNTAYEPFSGPR
jgi:hypothetical protein